MRSDKVSSSATCRLDSPRAASRSTSTSRSVRPPGHAWCGRGRPAASTTAAHAARSSRLRRLVDDRGRPRPRPARAVRTRLRHGGEDVRGGDQPRGPRAAHRPRRHGGNRCRPAARDGRRRRRRGAQRGAAVQHAPRPVRVQPTLFPVGRAERAGTVPHGARDTRAAEIVQEGRAAQRGPVGCGDPRQRRGRVGERRYVRGVAEQEPAFQIDDDRDRFAERRESPCRPRPAARARRRRPRPAGPARELGEHRVGIGDEPGGRDPGRGARRSGVAPRRPPPPGRPARGPRPPAPRRARCARSATARRRTHRPGCPARAHRS